VAAQLHAQIIAGRFITSITLPPPIPPPAGHETTAATLGFLLYYLACHPRWEAAIREEARVRKGQQGGGKRHIAAVNSAGRCSC
jgi:hypothetical protein